MQESQDDGLPLLGWPLPEQVQWHLDLYKYPWALGYRDLVSTTLGCQKVAYHSSYCLGSLLELGDHSSRFMNHRRYHLLLLRLLWWLVDFSGPWKMDSNAFTVSIRVLPGVLYFAGDQWGKCILSPLWLKSMAKPGEKQVTVVSPWKFQNTPCRNHSSFPAQADTEERGLTSQAGSRGSQGP